MTIDGVNILQEYGLKLIKLEDYYDLPARKKVLTEPGVAAQDIVFEARRATVTLKAVFATTELFIQQLKAFETVIKWPLKHAVTIPEHGLAFTATAADGFEVKTWLKFNAAVVKLTLTIIEE